ncbi:hypothetical protein [Nocardia gipuzkoensis]
MQQAARDIVVVVGAGQAAVHESRGVQFVYERTVVGFPAAEWNRHSSTTGPQ